MLIGALLALLVVSGAPLPVVAAIALALIRPVWFLVAAAVWAVVARQRRAASGPDEEAAFLRGLAAELSAGSGLRAGVVAASGRAPGLDLARATRLCSSGRPAAEVGVALGEALPVNRSAIGAAFRLSSRTGGPIAPLIETLAARAEAMGRLERERRASTAQARLSAWVVGGLPIGLIVLALVTGAGPGAGDLGPVGVSLVGIGLGLIGVGSVVVAFMARRVVR
jgi:tight adherence protein B